MTRTQARTRRLSACHLHPGDPVSGICATCLTERLNGLDPSVETEPSSSTSHFTSVPHFVNAGDGCRSITGRSDVPSELRRCRSVVYAPQCDASSEPRRKSCDVGGRNGKTLAHLFDVADDCYGSDPDFVIESKKVIGGVFNELREEGSSRKGREDGDLAAALGVGDSIDDEKGNEDEEEEAKTMKEYIDLELQPKNQKKEFKELTGNLWEAASIFSKKLQKWRQKQKVKKPSHRYDSGFIGGDGEAGSLKGPKLGNTQSEASGCALRRRSCDTDPRFSVDCGRLSMDGGPIPFDEPRASWDGYMIARTIPTLTPMFSAMDTAILGSKNRFDNNRLTVDGLMHSIIEDDTSSGGSGQSNSDSSTSQRRSSFDRSSSVRSFGKKMAGLDMKYAANPDASPAKLVITESELKDWHLKSINTDQVEKLPVQNEKVPVVENGVNLRSKKSGSWHKVLNVFSFKQKVPKTKCNNSMGTAVDGLVTDAYVNQEKEVCQEVKDAIGWGLIRSNSIVSARRSFEVTGSNQSRKSCSSNFGCSSIGEEDFMLERNERVKYASKNLEGPKPFYMTPLRSSKSRRYERNKLQE